MRLGVSPQRLISAFGWPLSACCALSSVQHPRSCGWPCFVGRAGGGLEPRVLWLALVFPLPSHCSSLGYRWTFCFLPPSPRQSSQEALVVPEAVGAAFHPRCPTGQRLHSHAGVSLLPPKEMGLWGGGAGQQQQGELQLSKKLPCF